MDAVGFHREPPSNIPTMVVTFGGWIDAGEAVTGAMRYLVRQLAASPLASIDPEDFFDWLLLNSRVVDVPMAYDPTLVILSSLKALFFNSLKNKLRFSDNAGA